MSLSWANKLAKNALLTAQKRIDSVLDIKETDEETDQPVSEVDSAQLSALSDTTEVESNLDNESVKFDGNDESFTTARDNTNSTLVEIDLTATENPSGWDLSAEEDVVDSEPNPIRDAHDHPSTSILHYSPSSSNSPDEEERNNQHNQEEHSQNIEHFDLSLINLEPELPGSAPIHVHRKLSDRQHEDVITVASSDIVVIKNADDWSVASGSHRRMGSDQVSLSASVRNQKNSDDESLHDRILTLEAKLKHRDQRLEELSRLNENLKLQNTTLSQRNKQVNIKLAAESKLQKQLVEKDNELKELMNEGQKLSKQNAKQQKELKRLRDIEKESEQLNQQLTETNDELIRRTELESQLKDLLRKLEVKLEEKSAEIVSVQEKVGQKQELADDLKLSEQRCQSQKLQIAKLEQRIDELMAYQRASAEQIAELNAPLLANIDELENKLRETETEKYVLQKKIRLVEENVGVVTKKSTDEVNMLKQQLESLKGSFHSSNEKIRRMKSDYDELNEKHTKLNNLFQSVEAKLLTEISELKESIVKKDSEIVELKHELMVATNPKTPVKEKSVTPVENYSDLLEDLHELERENNNLRTKFNELNHNHETLLLLHGENIVKVQELEEQNQNIKDLCREQALLVASMNQPN